MSAEEWLKVSQGCYNAAPLDNWRSAFYCLARAALCVLMEAVRHSDSIRES